MAPYVDSGIARNPGAFICVLKFQGVNISGQMISEIFVRMLSAHTKEIAEKKLIRNLVESPRVGFSSQSVTMIHIEEVNPSELNLLYKEVYTDDSPSPFGNARKVNAVSVLIQ